MLGLDKVSLNVRDQEGAKRFWTETIGFEVVRDEPMGDAGSPRWIEVREPGGSVSLVLFATEFDETKIGALSGVLFTCDDIQQSFEQLRSRGVDVADEPRQESWGWWATFRDNEGNVYGLGQRS